MIYSDFLKPPVSLFPILHFHRSQILIMFLFLFHPCFSIVWQMWFGRQPAWIAAQPDIDSGVFFPAVTAAVRGREAIFSLLLTEWWKLYVDGSSPVSVSLFPAAAPVLNVRQASEPTHWLVGAAAFLLAYLGWKPLADWANVVSTPELLNLQYFPRPLLLHEHLSSISAHCIHNMYVYMSYIVCI